MKWLTDEQIARLVDEQRDGGNVTVDLPADAGQPIVFACGLNAAGARELLCVLNKAVNTWEPRDWPSWLAGWFKHLEKQ